MAQKTVAQLGVATTSRLDLRTKLNVELDNTSDNFDELYANSQLAALTAPVLIGSGANRLSVATDGTLTMQGTATVWEDLRESLTGKNLNSTAGKANYDFTNGWVRLESGGDIADDADVVQATFQTPHSMKTGGDGIWFHLHWLQTNVTSRTITGKYRVIINGSSPLAWTDFTATCTEAGDNAFPYVSGTLAQITDLFSINTAGLGLSTLIQVRFTRSDVNASADIYALYLDAHYEMDTLGSSAIMTK